MIDTIGYAILNSNAKNLDEALKINTAEGTIEDLIIAKTAKIGEKLSLRRIEVVEKMMMKYLAHIYTWVVK